MNQADHGWRKRQIALDAKAENARELGLDYEPKKTIMEMAYEAGMFVSDDKSMVVVDKDSLERFAELVRADERNSWPAEMEAMERQVNILTDALAQERERLKWDVHSCGPTCKRYACASMREAVQAEREACAKLLGNTDLSALKNNPSAQQFIAELLCAYVNAIRARGNI
jgi:hypothetical protein